MSWNLNEFSSDKKGTFEDTFDDPIPDNSVVGAYIEDAKWSNGSENFPEEFEFINLKWRIHAPAEYKNRVIFQKVRVNERDESKKRRAMQMLWAIDDNCGGTLAGLGTTPDDMQLQKALIQKPMRIKLRIWEIKDKKGNVERSGNWVTAVSPKGAKALAVISKAPELADDDLPF